MGVHRLSAEAVQISRSSWHTEEMTAATPVNDCQCTASWGEEEPDWQVHTNTHTPTHSQITDEISPWPLLFDEL